MKDFKIKAQKQTNKIVLEVTEVYTGVSNLYHALNYIILQFIEEVYHYQQYQLITYMLVVFFLLPNEYEDMPDNFRPFIM